MTDGPQFPGPGTAALFGAAIVFASLSFLKSDSSQFLSSGVLLISTLGAAGLLGLGFWIEYESFKIKREEQRLERIRLQQGHVND